VVVRGTRREKDSLRFKGEVEADDTEGSPTRSRNV